MKKQTIFFPILISLLLLVFYSCNKEQVTKNEMSGKGHVSLSIEGNNTLIESSSSFKSDEINNFVVEIYKENNDLIIRYEKLVDMPSSIELEAGTYYALVFSPNKKPVAFDEPYYHGQSEVFTIKSGDNKSISVECFIATAKVTVTYSENVKKSFTDYKVVVKNQVDSLIFLKDDTRAGFFLPGKLEVTAYLKYTTLDGSSKTKIITGTIASASARKHHELYVDATTGNGSSALNVTINDSLTSEVYSIKENNTGSIATMNMLSQGDILLTEVMPNPDKVSDDLGEWFEVYNNTSTTIDLNGMIVKIGTKSMKISQSILIASNQYVFFCKDIQGGSEAVQYYGAALSLTNTTGTIQILNSDTENAVVLSEFTYSSAPTGASLSLDPSSYNYALALNQASWCTATEIYSTGDKGTPGKANTPCN
ncbi:MAG: DUF4493 domain-containing protein [Bacteroidales bacterium]|nr:DUF4493 domain-containing protein [Bacteroidales bacterium]